MSQTFMPSAYSAASYGAVQPVSASSMALKYKIPEQLAGQIIATSARVGIPDPNWLADVIYFESKFNPQAKNPGSSATGLIQFMDATATELGTTTSALAKMTAMEQMPWVQKYFQLPRIAKYSPFKSRLDVFMSIYWPAAVGKGPGYAFPSSTWAANHGIKTAGDYERMALSGSAPSSSGGPPPVAETPNQVTAAVETVAPAVLTDFVNQVAPSSTGRTIVYVLLGGGALTATILAVRRIRRRR